MGEEKKTLCFSSQLSMEKIWKLKWKIMVNIFKKSTEQQQQQGIQDLSEILKKKQKQISKSLS